MVKYRIFKSGSDGNAVLIEERLMIDCGVPFKELTGHVRQIQLILLTHRHGDHFNPATVRRLARERPMLRWGTPEWLVAATAEAGVRKTNIDVFRPGQQYHYPAIQIEPVQLYHDVPNCGYKIRLADGRRIFYATDTSSLDGITAEGFDLYMVEANYTEADIRQRIQDKLNAGEYCYELKARDRHMSREKADNWIYRNMGRHSAYVYMHEHED